MRFYATKWWSTQGIIEFEGHVSADGNYASEDSNTVSDSIFLRLGQDAFVNLCEAEADVEHKAHLNLHSKERAFVKAGKLLQQAAEKKIKVVKR